MLSIKEASLCVVVLCFSISIYGETIASIMKAHDAKLEKAKKNYDASTKKISKYTVKRLEQLKKATTRAGKLKEERRRCKTTVPRRRCHDKQLIELQSLMTITLHF